MTRILIVDDERDIRTTLAYNLTHAGYRVVEAGNAFDAIEAVHNESVDLVAFRSMRNRSTRTSTGYDRS
jgi:DNA-binding response OmpR family regulator